MIAEPPLDDGAAHTTEADALPAVAVTPVGAPGTLALLLGDTEAECAELGPVPIAFVAATVKLYGVPFVRLP